MGIKQLILDVMKPHRPTVIEYANSLNKLDTVDGVNIIMIEVDKEVENIELQLFGDDLDFELIRDEIQDLAGAIHSVDQVIAGTIPEGSVSINVD